MIALWCVYVCVRTRMYNTVPSQVMTLYHLRALNHFSLRSVGLRIRGQVEPRIGDLPAVLQTLRETFEAPLEDEVAARLQALISGTAVDVARYVHARESGNGCTHG